MKAVFTVQLWSEVEDVEQAAEMAAQMDKAALANIEAVFEQHGATTGDLVGRLGFLGTSFWLLDEERVLG